ncbi:hypothetical protein ACFSYG_11940 [Leeuwenhoekiella polynyae]|uniref:Transglutaminase superfamily protein n=1 Tax=Leeuwenhoekiella polynyae TaxID=1550906 RepID=A0A4Q0PFQ9_9FLAO|nr:hypothetical protein [Leeuwenhoekiella polynyae]RXG25693.1 hypothetical protein DSM02_860 [Leeuwenhoekiella polynyae]
MSTDVDFLSAGLYRPLQSGKQYDRYIKGTNCKVTTLAAGDTFTTVKHMHKWVNQHKDQTVNLAPLLKGNSLADTANKIYRFLYDHIQYRADGDMQNLKSPGCTWATRKTGADCKTFSIFASSILTNLGIQHSIRQVSQPGYYPDQYTHVYVVIPENQKIKKLANEKVFVIDGTRHQNTEVQFIKKHDTLMLHQGLSAPATHRRTAAKKRGYSRGLNGVAVSTLMRDLTDLLNVLIMAGVPQSQMKLVQAEALKYVNAGEDPNFAINQSSIVVGSKEIPFFPSGLKRPGLGFDPVTIGIISQAAGSSGGAGDGAGLMSGILEGLNIAENFKLVTQYGLSSWGASSSPEKIKAEFAQYTVPHVKKMLNEFASNPEQALTNTKIYLEVVQDFRAYLRDNHSKAKSTRLANQAMIDLAKDLYNKVINETIQKLRGAGIIVTEVPATITGSFTFADSNERYKSASELTSWAKKNNFATWKGYKFTVPQSLKDQLNPSKDLPASNGSGDYGGSNGGSTNYPTTTGNYTPGTNTGSVDPNKTAGGLNMGMILLVAAGAGLAYTQLNKNKSASPSTSKKATPSKTKK